jgi:hypothetical protein
MKGVVAIALACALTGCGAANQYRAYQASENLNESAAAYRACLQAGRDCTKEKNSTNWTSRPIGLVAARASM